MTPEELIGERPRLHINQRTREPESWSLADDTFEFIGSLIGKGSTTMETGAGLSTVFLALCGTEHTAIAPDEKLFARIRDYCKKKNIDLGSTRFVAQQSEEYLPVASLPALDLFIIDGRHAFPTPGIDFYYSARALRLGGHMVVDDTQLLGCRILADYLHCDPHWEVARDFKKTSVFKKVDQNVHKQGHGMQELERSWAALRRGESEIILDKAEWLRLLRPRPPATEPA